MGESSDGRIKVVCACGAKLAAPANAAGRRIKCPKCSAAIAVPSESAGSDAVLSVAGSAESAARGSPGGDMGSLLDELAAAESQGAAPIGAPMQPRRPCPGCNNFVPGDAVLCVSCGYDFSSGTKHKPARTTTSVAERAVAAAGSTAALAGTFAMGCLFSAGGAVVGAAVWYGLAAALSMELGYVAWGLGALAGFGMRLGYRSSDAIAGVTAAGIAVAGIMAAKMLFFLLVVIPGATALLAPQAHADLRTEAQELMVDDILANDKLDRESATEKQLSSAEQGATVRLKASSDAEVKRFVDKHHAIGRLTDLILEERKINKDDMSLLQWHSAWQEANARAEKMGDADLARLAEASKKGAETDVVQALQDNKWKIFFMTSFNLVDVLFFVLAVASAYKLATR